ncbi:MAG TPA: hypothetical protein VL860_15685 [Planctomycetota bacterium]|nr:hypothetical protein [Planctomycetota bacterium]
MKKQIQPESISAFLDGEMSDGESRQFLAEIAQDPEASAELQRMLKLRELIADAMAPEGAPAPRLPQALQQRWQDAIRADAATRISGQAAATTAAGSARVLRPKPSLWRSAVPMAATVLVAAGVLWLFNRSDTPDATPVASGGAQLGATQVALNTVEKPAADRPTETKAAAETSPADSELPKALASVPPPAPAPLHVTPTAPPPSTPMAPAVPPPAAPAMAMGSVQAPPPPPMAHTDSLPPNGAGGVPAATGGAMAELPRPVAPEPSPAKPTMGPGGGARPVTPAAPATPSAMAPAGPRVGSMQLPVVPTAPRPPRAPADTDLQADAQPAVQPGFAAAVADATDGGQAMAEAHGMAPDGRTAEAPPLAQNEPTQTAMAPRPVPSQPKAALVPPPAAVTPPSRSNPLPAHQDTAANTETADAGAGAPAPVTTPAGDVAPADVVKSPTATDRLHADVIRIPYNAQNVALIRSWVEKHGGTVRSTATTPPGEPLAGPPFLSYVKENQKETPQEPALEVSLPPAELPLLKTYVSGLKPVELPTAVAQEPAAAAAPTIELQLAPSQNDNNANK